jgi:hypothetical protein
MLRLVLADKVVGGFFTSQKYWPITLRKGHIFGFQAKSSDVAQPIDSLQAHSCLRPQQKRSTSGGAVNGLVLETANGKLLWSQDSRVVSSATGSPTATSTTEATLTTVTFIDGMQLTSAGNPLLVTNTSAQVVNMASATKGTLSAITGDANCTSTIAVVGDDAYCSSNLAPGKALRLTGAGKL